jgi:hypothetical protein
MHSKRLRHDFQVHSAVKRSSTNKCAVALTRLLAGRSSKIAPFLAQYAAPPQPDYLC